MVMGSVVASWSRVQGTVACSSAEAEYYAMCTGAAEALFVHLSALELGVVDPHRAPAVLTDASAAKAMAEKNQLPTKVKHMQVRYLHMQNLVRTKRIMLKKVGTLDNVSDILTKSVNRDTLNRLLPRVGMVVHGGNHIDVIDKKNKDEEA